MHVSTWCTGCRQALINTDVSVRRVYFLEICKQSVVNFPDFLEPLKLLLQHWSVPRDSLHRPDCRLKKNNSVTLALSWGRHSLMMLELFLYLHDRHDWQCHNSPPSPCHNWWGSWWLHGRLHINACCDLMLTSFETYLNYVSTHDDLYLLSGEVSWKSAQYRSDPWTLWLLDLNLSYIHACYSRSIDFSGL